MDDRKKRRARFAKQNRVTNELNDNQIHKYKMTKPKNVYAKTPIPKYPKYLLQSFRIIADDRERAVIPHIQNVDGVNVKVERITTGDYCIMYPNGKMIIIERKTWADLADSIKDGRMANIRDLLRAQKEQGAKTIYMIEGIPPSKLTKKISGIAYRNLRSKVDHLILRDGMIVMETRGAKQTAERIIQLGINCSTLECYTDDKKNKNDQDGKKGGVPNGESIDEDNDKKELNDKNDKKELNKDEKKALVYMKQKKPDLSRHEIEMNMLRKLPGVSDATSGALLEKFTFYDILCVLSIDQLKEVKYIRTGASLRKKTMLMLSNPKRDMHHEATIISVIKGISSNVAISVASMFSLEIIINGEVTEEEISDIMNGERKVGKAVAKKIIEFFREA
jgi:ERCC4-type nuclease